MTALIVLLIYLSVAITWIGLRLIRDSRRAHAENMEYLRRILARLDALNHTADETNEILESMEPIKKTVGGA